MRERVLSSSKRASPGSFLGEVRTGGGEGNTISLLMEEKVLQIEPVKYLSCFSFSTERDRDRKRKGENLNEDGVKKKAG